MAISTSMKLITELNRPTAVLNPQLYSKSPFLYTKDEITSDVACNTSGTNAYHCNAFDFKDRTDHE
ncbi:MAG: hypothetical protein K2O97_05830, partial [Acetatifactor sp.]|nr:hypothetical protein [Acetatifactor sp.]